MAAKSTDSGIAITIDTKDLEAFEVFLSLVKPKDIDFVVSQTLNNCAFRALKKIQTEIPKYIDRPTPFVMRSLRVVKATKSNLAAIIEWKDYANKQFGAGRQLAPNAFGGTRRQKGFEVALQNAGLMPRGSFAVPADGAPQDSYGNVPAPYYVRLLAYLRADKSGTNNRPIVQPIKGKGAIAAGARARAKKRLSTSKFFAVAYGRVIGSTKSNGGATRLPDGIYERRPSAFGAAMRPIFFFVSKVEYKASFPIDTIVNNYVNDIIVDEMARVVDRTLLARAKFSK